MAIELKHLFNPEIVPQHLLAFALPNATGSNETCGQIGCAPLRPRPIWETGAGRWKMEIQPVNVSRGESRVTVGEWQPKNGIKGDLLLARIRWNRPNKLVSQGTAQIHATW